MPRSPSSAGTCSSFGLIVTIFVAVPTSDVGSATKVRSEVAERVDRGAVDAHLEVEVGAGDVAGRARLTDHSAALDLLADGHADRALVRVQRRQPAAVVDDRGVAVPA